MGADTSSTGQVQKEHSKVLSRGRILFWVAIIFVLSLSQSLYRLSLPSDNWAFPFDISEGKQRYVFGEYLGEGETPLQTGDVLLSIEGKSIKELAANAIRLRPQRPEDWRDGGTITYTVLRGEGELSLQIKLDTRKPLPTMRYILTGLLANAATVPQLLIAFFVFLKQPKNIAGRLFLFSGLLTFITIVFGQGVSGENTGTAELFYPWAYWPATISSWLLFPLFIVPTQGYIFLHFPEVKKPIRDYRRLSTVLVYALAPTLLIIAFVSRLNQPLAFLGAIFEIGFPVIFPVSMATAIISLVHTLVRSKDPVRKAQARWLVFGVIFGIAMGQGILFFLGEFGILAEGVTLTIVEGLVSLAFPLSLVITILRYQLWDIDVVINRTIIYGLLTAILAAVWAGSVAVINQLAEGLFGTESATTTTIMSTLLVVSIFQPLRKEVERWVNDRFFPESREIARDFIEFGSIFIARTSAPELLHMILDRVCSLMDTEYGAIYLVRTGGNLHPVEVCGVDLDELSEMRVPEKIHSRWGQARVISKLEGGQFSLLVPLYISRVREDEIIGVLALGPREGGRGYSWDDRRGLRTFGEKAGEAIFTSQFVDESRSARAV